MLSALVEFTNVGAFYNVLVIVWWEASSCRSRHLTYPQIKSINARGASRWDVICSNDQLRDLQEELNPWQKSVLGVSFCWWRRVMALLVEGISVACLPLCLDHLEQHHLCCFVHLHDRNTLDHRLDSHSITSWNLITCIFDH